MEKKNPVLAGLFNMLVPGSGHWYVDQDSGRFIKTLIVGGAAIVVVIVVGNIIENTTGFPLPQGLCLGGLLLMVLVPLFLNGQKAANHHNLVIDNASQYTARQQDSNASQRTKNQNLRDKGYISEQEYESRKDSIDSRKE
jgi:hypothetical protein